MTTAVQHAPDSLTTTAVCVSTSVLLLNRIFFGKWRLTPRTTCTHHGSSRSRDRRERVYYKANPSARSSVSLGFLDALIYPSCVRRSTAAASCGDALRSETRLGFKLCGKKCVSRFTVLGHPLPWKRLPLHVRLDAILAIGERCSNISTWALRKRTPLQLAAEEKNVPVIKQVSRPVAGYEPRMYDGFDRGCGGSANARIRSRGFLRRPMYQADPRKTVQSAAASNARFTSVSAPTVCHSAQTRASFSSWGRK